MVGNPINQGPNGDGSRSLAKESKAGLAMMFVVTVLAESVLGALTKVDLTTFTGWWVPLASATIGVASGLLTAWLKKNR